MIHSATDFSSGAMFGDSLSFSVNVSDTEVALSTVKAQLYYGPEMVSEVVIRTKTDGDYSGRFYVPFYQYTPNETAKVVYVLQNVNLTTVTKTVDLPLTRPEFPYLTFISGGNEYKMLPVGDYEYEVTETFPSVKMSGYIVAPAMGTNGNEITFGWLADEGAVKEGTTDNIPFSYDELEFTISFNTLTYVADPFKIAYLVNGKPMERIDDDTYRIDLELQQGDEIVFAGIDGMENWWIDPDFFDLDGNGNYTFIPADGKFRFTADFDYEYIRVEALSGNDLATLNSNGTGAIWVIGDNVGKPSLANTTGWTTELGLLMPYMGDKKFRISFVAGKTISTGSINFKFFHQRDWGGEFTNETLTTNSQIVFIGDGSGEGDAKRDPGNLGLKNDNPLIEGKTYVFTIDLAAGNDKGVLTVEEK
ncbi:MAG: DUF5125 domain-containing protein [Tannerellaceae bacterium]|nr:DUF5125 domain-containing protein [Tannerellaceae bacterium]